MLSGKELVKIGDVIVAMYDDEESFASYFLRKEQMKRRDLLNYIAHGISVVDTFDTLQGKQTMKKKSQLNLRKRR